MLDNGLTSSIFLHPDRVTRRQTGRNNAIDLFFILIFFVISEDLYPVNQIVTSYPGEKILLKSKGSAN